ncbi:MAG: hypothetical protein ABIT07_09025 [Ferruginibacter sp.]
MKMNTVGIVTPINKDEMKKLLEETKETLATDHLDKNNETKFAVVNMWKIRKTALVTSSMRRRSF